MNYIEIYLINKYYHISKCKDKVKHKFKQAFVFSGLNGLNFLILILCVDLSALCGKIKN